VETDGHDERIALPGKSKALRRVLECRSSLRDRFIGERGSLRIVDGLSNLVRAS
jgi:hypothetical protein